MDKEHGECSNHQSNKRGPPSGSKGGLTGRAKKSSTRGPIPKSWSVGGARKDGYRAEIEVHLRVGGSYRIGMRRRSGGSPVYVRGSFLVVNSPEKLAYTWHWENAFEKMPETVVTVQFTSDGAATVVWLT